MEGSKQRRERTRPRSSLYPSGCLWRMDRTWGNGGGEKSMASGDLHFEGEAIEFADVQDAGSDSFAISWTVACQALMSMGFSRQEYWSRLPFPFPEDLLDLGIEPTSPAWQVDSLPSEPPGKPVMNYRKEHVHIPARLLTALEQVIRPL